MGGRSNGMAIQHGKRCQCILVHDKGYERAAQQRTPRANAKAQASEVPAPSPKKVPEEKPVAASPSACPPTVKRKSDESPVERVRKKAKVASAEKSKASQTAPREREAAKTRTAQEKQPDPHADAAPASKKMKFRMHVGPSSSKSSSVGTKKFSNRVHADPSANKGSPADACFSKRMLKTKDEIYALGSNDLIDYIILRGWPEIAVPKWEGARWCELIAKLSNQEVPIEEVAEAVVGKQRRQLQEQVRQRRLAEGRLFGKRLQERAKAGAPDGCAGNARAHKEHSRFHDPQSDSDRRQRKPHIPSSIPSSSAAGGIASSLAPAENLSAWAREQVQKVFREVKAAPDTDWKHLLRQKMLLFHPDKKRAPDHPYASQTDEQVAEVFVAVKRAYDRIGLK